MSRKKVEIGYEAANAPTAASPAEEEVLELHQVAVLPDATDNCAIAVRQLPAGLKLKSTEGVVFSLPYTVLEGHRFVSRAVAAGERLTSWALGFGVASRPIEAGEYVCNDTILAALRERNVNVELPSEGNFENHFDPMPDADRELDHSNEILPVLAGPDGKPLGFSGFLRTGSRGVGTRNYLIVLGTSGRVAAFARRVERRFRGSESAAFNGVVAVAHTEGADVTGAHNRDKVDRCLSGFLVHPNVGACLVVDHPMSAHRENMEELMKSNPEVYRGLSDMPVRWMAASEDVDADLELAAGLVEELLPSVRAATRSFQPASNLAVAQQCGGSDAFSGVAGNPASGGAVKRLIAAGGKSLLAETDELIGAEAYILSKTASKEVETKFRELVVRFREYTGRHGHSAEGNPSGGNKFRGLYNIALKSVGAAMKKPKDVRLEGCVEYGQPITSEPRGYYFMDSPGNDMESIAGQVASGCNIIHFITGNGSITNFPFVPTIKIITTTNRWNLLSKDMDFNAGRLQQGVSLESLSEELFQDTLAVSGGRITNGEKAAHWQIHIWRDWYLAEGASRAETEAAQAEDDLADAPLATRLTAGPSGEEASARLWQALPPSGSPSAGLASARAVGLVLPTSLCSGQVAVQISEKLRPEAEAFGLQSVVALPHTEGCGRSSSEAEDNIFRNVMVGHLLHPAVRRAVLLEHGCEKTHNDWFASRLRELGHDPSKYGWASIQVDGGIEKTTAKVRELLLSDKENKVASARKAAGLPDLRVGVLSDHTMAKNIGLALASLVGEIVRGGGTAVVAQHNELLSSAEFLDELLEGGSAALCPTVRFATPLASSPGLHVMSCPPRLSFTEQVTGLASTGADVIIAAVRTPMVGSPLVPVIQARCVEGLPEESPAKQKGFDVCLSSGASTLETAEHLWEAVLSVASGRQPKVFGTIGEGSVDFIVPRGKTGVSL